MTKTASSGKCRLCGQLFGKAQMSRHLKACVARSIPAASTTRRTLRCFHLVIEASYFPSMWLHLEVPTSTLFGQLDRVLRDIWLECCGHMSAFRFPEARVPVDFFVIDVDAEIEKERRLMSVEVGQRFKPGVKLRYEYDSGSTTDLTIRVLDERDCPQAKPRIRLLARNEPPDIPCTVCGKPATVICIECDWTGDGALCDPCATRHECDEEMRLPVINSPRMGVCAYTGPSIEPA